MSPVVVAAAIYGAWTFGGKVSRLMGRMIDWMVDHLRGYKIKHRWWEQLQ